MYKPCLQRGSPSARRIAAEKLREIDGAEATQLIISALDDEDVEVQSIATGQFRDRNVPDALALLVEKAENGSTWSGRSLKLA